jgi:hypothetical protein
MHGDVLERHALELAYRVQTSQMRMVTVHWCLHPATMRDISEQRGAITAQTL